jgi:hypothetical protein
MVSSSWRLKHSNPKALQTFTRGAAGLQLTQSVEGGVCHPDIGAVKGHPDWRESTLKVPRTVWKRAAQVCVVVSASSCFDIIVEPLECFGHTGHRTRFRRLYEGA